MNNIKIVPMNADHLESLERLERICFSRPWSRKMLAEELENQCAAFLVAEDAVTGDVLGYAGLLVAADEGYITNVAVFPEQRRRGIAGQLLQVFLNFAEANHLAFLTLEVRPSNTAAIALYLAFPELEPPFLALAISGGNTLIVDVRDYTDMAILGATRDDAAGECFDKAARVLGLPYPGGKPMDVLAQQSPGGKYTLPRVHVEGAELDMSFSGLKTAVVNLAHNAQQKGEPLDAAALARDFTQAVSDELVPRAMEAARRTGRRTIVAAGGVAANSIIRGDLERACRQAGCRLYLPPLRLCGDNGAMIGAQGYYEYLAGHTADLSLNAYATRDLDRG